MKKYRENRFGLCISIINRAAQGYFYHKLKGFKIGPGQQAYLLALLPGETIFQEELAKRLKVDKANVTRAIKGLEKNDYILRARSPMDKRAWEISLSKKGIRIRAEIERISKEWIDILKKPLSDSDWNTLEEYLYQIAIALD
ncbi:MAG: MarR family transcriptional regulator [Spirochaetaceae bacterium]|nr:MAG: MarR family transcriptional regulator [Spirochaetaceae bacterium]